MRVTEIIRNILDLIDNIESKPNVPKADEDMPNEQFYDDEIRRLRQIADLDNNQQIAQYSNTPKEEYAGIEAVTTAAGGGPNAPKHPHDIRVKDPSMYPNQQEY
jgi:hypothetical protein